MAKKEEKKERISIWTPPGRFSYPFFAEPDNRGHEYSDGCYKCDFFIPKPIFKEKAAELQKLVLFVGQEEHGKAFTLKSDEYYVPFKDMDLEEEVKNEAFLNCIMIRPKAKPSKKDGGKPARQPLFVGPRKNESGKFDKLTQEEIAAIKGGDWGRCYVDIYAYTTKPTKTNPLKGGVTFGLRMVQFWKEGDAFGQGVATLLNTVEELESELDEVVEETADSII